MKSASIFVANLSFYSFFKQNHQIILKKTLLNFMFHTFCANFQQLTASIYSLDSLMLNVTSSCGPKPKQNGLWDMQRKQTTFGAGETFEEQENMNEFSSTDCNWEFLFLTLLRQKKTPTGDSNISLITHTHSKNFHFIKCRHTISLPLINNSRGQSHRTKPSSLPSWGKNSQKMKITFFVGRI